MGGNNRRLYYLKRGMPMISTDDKRLEVVDYEITEIDDVLWIKPIYDKEFKD